MLFLCRFSCRHEGWDEFQPSVHGCRPCGLQRVSLISQDLASRVGLLQPLGGAHTMLTKFASLDGDLRPRKSHGFRCVFWHAFFHGVCVLCFPSTWIHLTFLGQCFFYTPKKKLTVSPLKTMENMGKRCCPQKLGLFPFENWGLGKISDRPLGSAFRQQIDKIPRDDWIRFLEMIEQDS